ncbi:hypothetical protein [Photobacterium andalusiense]|uniref:Uncharacterized protein n=1 Tax=Photobacterium andalusiense TaxID=2204296 RepID=A0A1Y6MES8_9GAMM|nr:hypothetical protein [Photobacterium andalusiense]SMY34982.1 hypothetical protein PAND9192_01650 [Photobacterium andalusiense]
MFTDVLINCSHQIDELTCCKKDSSPCNCVSALMDDYSIRPDSYDCIKKMSTYSVRYGPAYISEVYHYLVATNFTNFLTTPITKIISLGCGFAPDYYAIKKYRDMFTTSSIISYTGIDRSTSWEIARPVANDCNFISLDLTAPFSLSGANVVIINKVFSTLYRNSMHTSFLTNLESEIRRLPQGTVIIFIDINHYNMGRDVFHTSVSSILPNFTRYYFDGHHESNWVKIHNNNLILDIPEDLSVSSLESTGSTVVFEYRK